MIVRTTKTASSYVERLSQKVERLEECLLAPMAVGTRNWVQRVGWAFDEMIDAWNLHRTNFDSDDGPLSAEKLKGTMLSGAGQACGEPSARTSTASKFIGGHEDSVG